MNRQSGFGTLSYRVADTGVAYITLDVRDRSVNVLTPRLHREIGQVAERLAADDEALGAVIHSGKSSFMAGGDLKRIVRFYDKQRSPATAYRESRTFTESLRKLETCGKPVAVAINGTALGGGLELALACHYRVVLDEGDIALGLPEVTLGLIPGGGGTQRLPRLIGIQAAADLILSGRRLSPPEALELGIVDQLAPAEDVLNAAERWILENGEPRQPWDRKGYRIPGGSGLRDLGIGGLFSRLTAMVGAEYRHNYPAPIAALRCLFNGTAVGSMDEALRIETREFSALTRDPVARNIIRTQFIHRGEAERAEGAEAARERRREFSAQLKQAFLDEGRRMAAEGISEVLLDNVAFAAGMPQGSLEFGEKEPDPADRPAERVDTEPIRLRLLFRPALLAAEQWAEGQRDAAEADLASVLDWDYPGYTGGVMSYVDTMGLGAFVAGCDQLAAEFGERFRPSAALRRRAQDSDRVYPARE